LRSNLNYYNNGTIPWLKTGELNDGIIRSTEEHITELALKECSLRINPIGSVLIAMYGATIGKLAIAGIDLTTNQACCACQVSNAIVNQYLFFFLQAIKSLLIKKGAGGAQPNISREIIVGTLIPIPPKEEQNRILKKLSFTLDKIRQLDELNKDVKKLSSQLKYKILDLFFGENSRYKSYSKNLKDLGMLISGRDLTPDGYNSDNNGIPYLTGASNFENDSVIVNRWTSKPIVISYYNDVLITCKGTIGKIAINQIGECHIARQIMAFRCGESLLPEYVKLFLDYRTAELQRASSSLIPGISRAVILNMAIPVPTIQMQHKIVFSLKSMLAQIAKMDS